MNKSKIWKELTNFNLQEIEEDFKNLREIGKDAGSKGLSTIGNKVVDYFTGLERLNTIGNKGINFFQFFENRKEYSKKKYIQNILKYYETNVNDATIKEWKSIFQLYFGSVNIFRPLIAMGLYTQFAPKCILDPTMGWGGRLVGACALDIPHYIGIDLNRKLIKPYEKMTKFLSKHSTTKIELYFGDCITFDYSKIEYDMVLTSPPYYNIEQYSFQEKRSKQEWNEHFYIPLVTETFKYLKKGGKYCLNIPIEVFELVKTILGEPNYTTPFPKSQRGDPNAKVVKGEFIYIWEK
jgi:hypothetical protein